jgi:hypothetical protein
VGSPASDAELLLIVLKTVSCARRGLTLKKCDSNPAQEGNRLQKRKSKKTKS